MMIHPSFSPSRIRDGVLRIDRKFHDGMLVYAAELPTPIVVVTPEIEDVAALMDAVEVPVVDLPYQVEIVRADGNHRPAPDEAPRLEALVDGCRLLYGTGFGLEDLALAKGVPFIPVVEYNLRTQIEVVRLPVSGALRRAVRTLKAVGRFAGEVRRLRRSHSIHCNGYPIYEQSRRLHDRCLLYLDSRMSEDMILAEDRLEARLASLAEGRRPRLVYSGRYESMKGALDVVEIGIALYERGIDFELDLYGKGSLEDAMHRRVEEAGAGGRVRVNEAIPYPELVARSHESDVFVCCHVQDDPSCTYLEASGSGLPIAGYDNRMWRHFARDADNGLVTPMRRPERLAEALVELLGAPDRIAMFARRSRAFALEHSFEREFAKRIDALQAALTTA